MTQEIALLGGLFNAFLWGSWAVVLKKLEGYPLDAFFFGLYIVSFAFVWFIALVTLGEELFKEIAQVWQERSEVIAGALIVGAAYVIGMRILLTVCTAVGLSVTAPISDFHELDIGHIARRFGRRHTGGNLPARSDDGLFAIVRRRNGDSVGAHLS